MALVLPSRVEKSGLLDCSGKNSRSVVGSSQSDVQEEPMGVRNLLEWKKLRLENLSLYKYYLF